MVWILLISILVDHGVDIADQYPVDYDVDIADQYPC